MWLLSTVRKRLSEQTSRGENHEDQTPRGALYRQTKQRTEKRREKCAQSINKDLYLKDLLTDYKNGEQLV